MNSNFLPFPPRLRAVLLDWAGTTVDYGSIAPAEVFREILRREGVEITMAESREPMGMAKRDHMAAILDMPRVQECWIRAHGRGPNDGDIERMYRDFLPLQQRVLRTYSHVIPGVPAVVGALRERGLKIGSSTGYTRELMEDVLPLAEAEGYAPDVLVCPEEVPAGRPAPWLNHRAAEKLGVYPPRAIAIVDDTKVGIAAGRNAGMWCVAVARTGNALGLSLSDSVRLTAGEWASRLATIRAEFLEAGAHFVIDGVADLLPVIEEIDSRLRSDRDPGDGGMT